MIRKIPPIFSTWQWIVIASFLAGSAVSVTVFAYTEFETKDTHDKLIQMLVESLDRIESKVDNLKR